MGMRVYPGDLNSLGLYTVQLRRGRAMRVLADQDDQFEIVCQSNRFAGFEASRQLGDKTTSPGDGRAYRGSWAEQRVVARLATNRTKKATRITTTPPTVSRSQRSELSRASKSRNPVITLVLISNFTVLTDDCSDQDHRQTLCPSPRQRRIASTRIFPFVFRERRFA
jgi:hypothetical protein